MINSASAQRLPPLIAQPWNFVTVEDVDLSFSAEDAWHLGTSRTYRCRHKLLPSIPGPETEHWRKKTAGNIETEHEVAQLSRIKFTVINLIEILHHIFLATLQSFESGRCMARNVNSRVIGPYKVIMLRIRLHMCSDTKVKTSGPRAAMLRVICLTIHNAAASK